MAIVMLPRRALVAFATITSVAIIGLVCTVVLLQQRHQSQLREIYDHVALLERNPLPILPHLSLLDERLSSMNSSLVSLKADHERAMVENAELRRRLDRLQVHVDSKADIVDTPQFKDLPVTPNLLKDSKHFSSFCDGKAGVEKPWSEAWGAPWSFYSVCITTPSHDIDNSALLDLGASHVEVVDLTDSSVAQQADLLPLGDLLFFVNPSKRGDGVHFYGADFRALVLTVRLKAVAESTCAGQAQVIMQQDCPKYTSWNVGQFVTEVGAFVKVLHHEGDIRINLMDNRGAGIGITGQLERRWQWLHNSKLGFGGCEQSQILGVGSMKVAIALPYESFGNHSNVPVWAGYDSGFFLGNS